MMRDQSRSRPRPRLFEPKSRGLGPHQPLRRLRPRYGTTARPGRPDCGLRPGDSLRKAQNVRSAPSAHMARCGVTAMTAEPPEGRKVKSGPVGTIEAADRHERAKDYLSPAEMARLLDAE